jgi:hypothetical protein
VKIQYFLYIRKKKKKRKPVSGSPKVGRHARYKIFVFVLGKCWKEKILWV